MTQEERRKLNAGLTQSSSDDRRYNGKGSYSQTNVGSNRTIIDGNTYYGYSDAAKAREKKEGKK